MARLRGARGARAGASRERGGEGRHLLVQRALEFRGRAARGELVRERRGDAHQADGERVQIQREVAGEGDVAAHDGAGGKKRAAATDARFFPSCETDFSV